MAKGKFTDPAGVGGRAQRGNRNSPPLNVSCTYEHELGGDRFGISGSSFEQGFRKLSTPGPTTNSPDMPVKSTGIGGE